MSPEIDFADRPAQVERASEGTVRAQQQGPLLEAVLNRPDKLNAINRAVLAGLTAVVDWCTADPSVRVLVLRGEGRGFSAGGDLDEVKSLVPSSERFNAFLDEWHAALGAVEACCVPVVAAVHGMAFAGGFELVQVCDVVVAGEDTRIGDQHANFGLFPAGGSTQRLPRLAGPRAGLWLLLSGEHIDAHRAWQLGVVTEVVPEADVVGRAREMATLLSERSAAASAAIKEAVRLGSALDVPAALRAEREIAVRHMASDDVQVGLAAFRSRSRPDFTTRRRS
jgi:enoyl-CoA hydratase/carnithine racemase